MKENGEWGTPIEQEDQMTALSAELSKKMEIADKIEDRIERRYQVGKRLEQRYKCSIDFTQSQSSHTQNP